MAAVMSRDWQHANVDHQRQGPLLLTWINSNPSMDK